MKWTTLDKITRSILLQRRLPIHCYVEYLKYASDIFREFHFDTLRVVNSKILRATDTGIVSLPCDFVDYVRVGIPQGQWVRPLIHKGGLTRLVNRDAAGRAIPWGSPPVGEGDELLWVGSDFNEHGEFLGRLYNYGAGPQPDTFILLKHRGDGELQLHEALGACEIVLDYISDGTACDSATTVEVQAQAAIEDYAKWQGSPNRDNLRSPEAYKFHQSWKRLKRRLDPLSLEGIKRIYYQNYGSVIR